MAINDFIEIPADATAAGAPIDAFLLRSMRTNDVVLEAYIMALMSTGFAPMGQLFPSAGSTDVAISGTPGPAEQVYQYNADSIDLQVSLTAFPRVPIVWFARKTIDLRANLVATGMGAQATENGDFGGSGGGDGAGNPAPDCQLPFTNVTTVAGGGAGSNGNALPEHWASRAFMQLAGARGGGSGADAGNQGGPGGGIVILCAPTINFNGNRIIANGGPGAGANSGGGGGGLVLLICKDTDGSTADIDVNGGNGTGTGSDGGNGYARVMQFT